MGDAQRLEGGNILITEATFGRVFEVTEKGRIVWEWVNEEFKGYGGFRGW
jgi:hypothetical protein